jgi:hypothetical protein
LYGGGMAFGGFGVSRQLGQYIVGHLTPVFQDCAAQAVFSVRFFLA